MREIVRMIVVLTLISLASGGLLAALREGTQERIDQQVLEFVKGPGHPQRVPGCRQRPDRQPLPNQGRQTRCAPSSWG